MIVGVDSLEGLGDDDRIASVAVDKRQNGVGRALGLGNINRKGFGEALSPSSFALVLRNTDCDNGVDGMTNTPVHIDLFVFMIFVDSRT